MQIHFLVGQAEKPVKAKGRAGCPPHNKLFLQKWDAPFRINQSRSNSQIDSALSAPLEWTLRKIGVRIHN